MTQSACVIAGAARSAAAHNPNRVRFTCWLVMFFMPCFPYPLNSELKPQDVVPVGVAFGGGAVGGVGEHRAVAPQVIVGRLGVKGHSFDQGTTGIGRPLHVGLL